MTIAPHADDTDLPLSGLKVLDFTRVLAGPFGSAMLADAGADVIKIEPFEGDDYRHMGYQVDGRSTNFEFVNRGKRSVRLNLKAPGAADVIAKLAQWADVALENFKPGVANRLGIGYEHLSHLNPGLVYCSISGFGQTGPWAERPAYDVIIQAMTGLMDLTGDPEGPPTFVGESVADVAAGMFASWGVMAALWQRSRTGRGRHLDVAMYDCIMSMMPTAVSRVVAGGTTATRVGNRHVNSAPFGVFNALDGQFVLAVANDRLFAKLASAMDSELLRSDARFIGNKNRKTHEGELTTLIETWARDKSVATIVDHLEQHGVPAGPVLSVKQSTQSDLATSRAVVTQRMNAGGGNTCFVEQPVRFGGLPRGQSRNAPELGAQTTDILNMLGFSAGEIADLREKGVV